VSGGGDVMHPPQLWDIHMTADPFVVNSTHMFAFHSRVHTNRVVVRVPWNSDNWTIELYSGDLVPFNVTGEYVDAVVVARQHRDMVHREQVLCGGVGDGCFPPSDHSPPPSPFSLSPSSSHSGWRTTLRSCARFLCSDAVDTDVQPPALCYFGDDVNTSAGFRTCSLYDALSDSSTFQSAPRGLHTGTHTHIVSIHRFIFSVLSPLLSSLVPSCLPYSLVHRTVSIIVVVMSLQRCPTVSSSRGCRCRRSTRRRTLCRWPCAS
jgi:hypothetical protein